MPWPHETFLKYMLFFPLITLHCPRSKFFFWISWMVVISGFTTVVDTHCFDGSGTETGNTLRMIYAKYYRKWAGWRGSKPENTYTVNFSTHPGNVAEPEPEPPGAATFRVVPEPIFLLAGVESRSRLFEGAPAPATSIWQAKKESLVIQKRLNNSLLRAQNEKCYCMEQEPPFFCLEPEPTQFGRSRLRDLGLPEPEPPKKVAAPQHCLWLSNLRQYFSRAASLGSAVWPAC